ncbi:MAG: ABC transporter substrate-binding protein [Roseivirga sp.]
MNTNQLLRVGALLLLMLGLWLYSKRVNAPQGNAEKVLEIAVTDQVKTMDPVDANDDPSQGEISKVYEGLLEYHYLKRPYELIPNLAAAMPSVSEDGLTYTFELKKGVKFHDNACFPEDKGRELVAADFVYSIKRLADPQLRGLGFSMVDGKIQGLNAWRQRYVDAVTDYTDSVEGLQALDSHTLQIKLVRSWPQFLQVLANPQLFVVPQEAVQHYGQEFMNHPVGTGPFTVEKFDGQANKIIFYKNPTFRKKHFPTEAAEAYQHCLKDADKALPLVDKIVAHIMVESQPRWLKFQAGGLDHIAIPSDNLDVIPNKELTSSMQELGIQLQHAPSINMHYIAFNHLNGLFKNIKLRQAMSMAYDREEFNKLFCNGMSTKASSILPPSVAGYRPDYVNPYGYDLEKAKELLAEAGYPGGKGLPEITLDVGSTTQIRQLGEHFQKSMEKIGVRIKVISNPFPELMKKVRQTKSTMLYSLIWVGDYPDAENFFQILYGPNKAPGPNGANFNDAEFNALYEEASLMQDGPARTALYEQLNQMAAEKAPLIYLVYPVKYVLHHGWLQNYVLAPNFLRGQAQYLNIDLEKKQAMKAKL